MKKHLIISIIALFTTMLSYGQGGQGMRGRSADRDSQREEIQSMKIAYMSDFLSLTSAESEKYWPIYNRYWESRVKIAMQRRDIFERIEKESATQADADALVKLTKDEADLMSKFVSEAARVVSIDKAVKTFVAEEKFKGTLLRRTQGMERKQ